LRIELIAKRAKADALETLATITRDKAVDPVERRRAASAVLRALATPKALPAVPPRARHQPGSLMGARSGHPAAATGQSDLGASHHDAPAPPDSHEAEQARRAAEEAHERQLQQWQSDADAIRRRLDFKTAEAAAQSVAKIITTA